MSGGATPPERGDGTFAARSPSAALTPLAEAVALLTEGVAPAAPRRVATAAACGLVAARDVLAEADRPSRPTATRDGWATALEAVAGASPHSPVLLAAAPAWVECGDALPAGCDAVLPPEAVAPGRPREIVADAGPGEGSASAGTDLSRGDVLLRAGERVTPLRLLALATAGTDAIEARVPRIKLVAAAESGVPDALTPTLAALVAAQGGEAPEIVRAPGGALACALAAGDADAVLVVGGTGFGRRDRAVAALAEAGTVRAHGVALRPGGAAGFGEAAGRPVLLLPGRPEACLAAFLALGRPLLAALAGTAEAPGFVAPLLRKVTSTVGVSEIAFVRRRPDGLEPLGGADLPLRRLLAADGFVLLPPDREGHPPGALVEWRPL